MSPLPPSEFGAAGHYAELRRLTLIGSSFMVDDIATGIFPHSPKLQSLIVSAHEHCNFPVCNAFHLLRHLTAGKQRLKFLALYGTAARGFSPIMMALRCLPNYGDGFDYLERLVVERSWETPPSVRAMVQRHIIC